MGIAHSVELSEIGSADLDMVADFLHVHMNNRVTAADWASAVTPPWRVDSPNHGFMLKEDGRVVGAYLAIYSDRVIDGHVERFCNLAAWCVLGQFRSYGLRLVRAMLAQQGFHFTDLSPSGNVVALNKRLRFHSLDTTTALVPNLPWPGPARTRVTSDPEVISRMLRGRDVAIYRDHVATSAARHIVVERGAEYCYLIVRRDRRKGLPLFASILYVGNPDLFADVGRAVYRHLLLRHRALATLAEIRLVGARPPMSIALKTARPKMYRSERLQPEQIDYLYSELACLAW
jgi:hypothetical protein